VFNFIPDIVEQQVPALTISLQHSDKVLAFGISSIAKEGLASLFKLLSMGLRKETHLMSHESGKPIEGLNGYLAFYEKIGKVLIQRGIDTLTNAYSAGLNVNYLLGFQLAPMLIDELLTRKGSVSAFRQIRHYRTVEFVKLPSVGFFRKNEIS
jgi:hypothetical protein